MEQVELKLRSRWGGARKGAGRRRTKPTYVRHRVREKLAARLPVHVTVRMVDGIESMRQRRLFKVVAGCFRAAQGKFGMRLTHFSVQGKHLHLIVEGVDKVGLRRAMTGLNVRIARRLNQAMSSMGRCVKERYHTHILKTPSEVRKAVHYVLKNHEHHGGGPGPDPCSSELNLALVVEPQTWLLQHAFDPPPRERRPKRRRAPHRVSWAGRRPSPSPATRGSPTS